MGQKKEEAGELSDRNAGLTPVEGGREGRKAGGGVLDYSVILSVFAKATREFLS